MGHRGDLRTCRTGTIRAVSPDLPIFVLVTVRRATELVNVMLPLDNAVSEEKVL